MRSSDMAIYDCLDSRVCLWEHALTGLWRWPARMIVNGLDRRGVKWSGLVVSIILGLALGSISLISASPARAECPPSFVLDFDGLPAGTVLGEQYASLGVHISAVANSDFPDAAIVFGSDTPSSHDPDLSVGVGNIAILAKNLNDVEPAPSGDGLVDDPDENDFGGRQVYAFDQAVHIGSFLFIDKDHGTPDKAVAYDGSNSVITEVPIPLAGNGSVQTINVNADGVRRLEIVYRDSAGLTGIEFGCEATPTPSPTPSPTASPTPSPTPSPTIAPTASPSPSPTLVPTASASTSPTPATLTTATPTPPPPLAIIASPVPTTTPPALAVSLPTAGGRLSLRDQQLKLALVGSVPLGLMVAGFLLALRSPRRGRGA